MVVAALAFLKSLPWQLYAGVAALLLLAGTVAYCSGQVEKRVEEAVTTGQVQEQNAQLEAIIENVGKANEAVEDITEAGPAGDRIRYDQCLRTARTPANCERFLPSLQPDNSGG